MTHDIPDNWNNYSARFWADGKPKRRNIAARRADWARIDERNSKDALRKAIYDTPPDDTPFVSEVLRDKGEWCWSVKHDSIDALSALLDDKGE